MREETNTSGSDAAGDEGSATMRARQQPNNTVPLPSFLNKPKRNMASKSNSNFTGVFTLKSQEEANMLAFCVKDLVERGVRIYHDLKVDGPANPEVKMMVSHVHTIARLAANFVELTLEEDERKRAETTVQDMTRISEEFADAVSRYNPRYDILVNDDVCKRIALCMQQFLEKTADLCDMMEENQTQRGIKMVNQALEYMDILRDPRYADFEAKVKHAGNALLFVDKLLENRCTVMGEQISLGKSRLLEMRKRLAVASKEVIDASVLLHKKPKDKALINREKEAMDTVKALLTNIQRMLSGGAISVKTNFGFSYEQVNESLNSLQEAVRAGSKKEAANQAQQVVQELQALQDSVPPDVPGEREELRRLSIRVVQATKNALESQDRQSELDDAVEEIRQQMTSLSLAVPVVRNPQSAALRLNLIEASQMVTDSMAGLRSALN